MEFNEENFNKLLTENWNYKQAMQEERSKRKKLQEEHDSLTKTVEELEWAKLDVQAQEKERVKKLEEQIVEKDQALATANAELEKATGKASKFDEVMNKSLEDKLAMIPEAKRELMNRVLDGKDHDAKLEILDGFIADLNAVPNVITTPRSDWDTPIPDPKTQRFAELKSKIDKREKVSPTERSEYLSLLRETSKEAKE